MRVVILSIFPDLFKGFLESSLIGKARQKDKVQISLVNIRDYSEGPHNQVDDSPYGGGAGMIMKPEPLVKAVEAQKKLLPNAKVILLSPSGTLYKQSKAEELSKADQLIFVCGRYEGVDERAIELVVDEEISIGDYVLMGGEVAAMVILETTLRLIPEIIGNSESIEEESFSISAEGGSLLEGPHYTRPAEFRSLKVPEVLLSGDHRKVSEWRRRKAFEKTCRNRPDLIKK